jgi:hypothetical protein
VTLKKVLKLVGVSGCPVCDDRTFDFEPGADPDDFQAMVRCTKCGHVCQLDQFMKWVPDSNGTTR